MKDILIKIIRVLAASALFVPLIVSGKFYFPFIFPKIWIFQMIVEVMVFFYAILILMDWEFRPRWNLVTQALVILTLVLVITSFFGVDIYRSFWGNTERMSGLIAWFHLLAFALIVSIVFWGEKSWNYLIGTSVVVSIIEFFYALFQYFGSPWVWFGTGDRSIGTIGNSDLIGGYAIFNAFFGLYLWRKYRGQNISKFWFFAFLMNVGTLFLSASRGALIAFVLGFGFYVLVLSYFDRTWRKIALILVVSILIILGSLWSFRNSDFVKGNVQLTRLVNFSLKDDTVQQRLTEWGIAWDAFLARPWGGWGVNNYLYLHNKFLDPRVYLLRETNFDRAHNAYLDFASMSGVFGVLAFLYLIGVFFWVFFKKQFWTFAALVVAWAVYSFFAFDSPASFITLFLTLGFGFYLKDLQLVQKRTLGFDRVGGLSPRVWALAFSIVLPVMIYIFWQVSVIPAQANFRFTKAFLGITGGQVDPENAFQYYKQALAKETLGTTEFRNQYLNWLGQNIGKFPGDKKLELIDFGTSELEKEVSKHPLVFSYLYLGQIYYFKSQGATSEIVRQELVDKAAMAFEKALELAPKRHEVYYAYLQMMFTQKDFQKGIELTKKLVEINPKYAQNWWYLGLVYSASGDDARAIENIDKALVLWYHDDKDQSLIKIENGNPVYNLKDVLDAKVSLNGERGEILGAVNPFIRAGRWADLLLLYRALEMIDPNDPQVHESLATVYQNLNLPDFAQQERSIVEKLKSSANK